MEETERCSKCGKPGQVTSAACKACQADKVNFWKQAAQVAGGALVVVIGVLLKRGR